MKSWYISGKELYRDMVNYCQANGIVCHYRHSDNTTLISVYGSDNEIAMVEKEFPQLKRIRK